MKIIKNVTIKLNEEELKQIVGEHMKKEGFDIAPKSISFDLGIRCVGHFNDGYEEAYFRGCTVECSMK